MQLVWGHKRYVAYLKGHGVFPIKNYAFTFQNEYFMFPSMCVEGAITVRFHLKEPHDKVWGTHLFGD
jgi:hypothetical protein